MTAALKEAPERIDVRGMDLAAHVFPGAVRDRFMPIARFGQVAIAVGFIGCDQINLIRDHLAHESVQRSDVRGLDYFADHVALACDRGDNRSLTDSTTARIQALGDMLVLFLVTDESLINLHDSEKFLELLVVHRGADSLAHIPGGFVTGLVVEDHALDLKSAHSLLGMEHQERDGEPNPERVFRVLEYRSGDDREPIALGRALLTLPVKRAMLERVNLAVVAAWAADAFRPPLLGQERLAGFFGREQPFQFAHLEHRATIAHL